MQKANLTCPDCGGDLVYRYGRYDKFIGCGQFPKCRYVKVKELGSCPDCATGKLTLKTAKRGREFVGCTNHPTCKYISNKIPGKSKTTTDQVKQVKVDLQPFLKLASETSGK